MIRLNIICVKWGYLGLLEGADEAEGENPLFRLTLHREKKWERGGSGQGKQIENIAI